MKFAHYRYRCKAKSRSLLLTMEAETPEDCEFLEALAKAASAGGRAVAINRDGNLTDVRFPINDGKDEPATG